MCGEPPSGWKGWCGAATGRVGEGRGERSDLAPEIANILAAGHVSLRAIAAELTARGICTRRGVGFQSISQCAAIG